MARDKTTVPKRQVPIKKVPNWRILCNISDSDKMIVDSILRKENVSFNNNFYLSDKRTLTLEIFS